MEIWLDNKSVLMYLTHSEGKRVDGERFKRSLKDKIYKKNGR